MLKKPLIIANWKANKTVQETLEWWREFEEKLVSKDKILERMQLVICPPFTALQPLQSLLISYRSLIKLGAQDISPFPDGPYTGEVSARMLIGLVDYVLIGHSEREKDFGENIKTAGQKIRMARQAGIIPILCVANLDEIPKEEGHPFYLLYEPPSAISQKGVYRPEIPQKAQKTIARWKSKLKRVPKFLYGGSVNSQNITQFLAQPDIDGVLVGHASLDPDSFWEVVNNVSA